MKKNKIIQEGSFCKGYTTSPSDIHRQDSDFGYYKKGDRKLRSLVIIESISESYHLVQFITNSRYNTNNLITFDHNQKEWVTNLSNCYIIHEDNISYKVNDLYNKEFINLKSKCKTFIKNNPHRAETYNNMIEGKYNSCIKEELDYIINYKQFSIHEIRHRELLSSKTTLYRSDKNNYEFNVVGLFYIILFALLNAIVIILGIYLFIYFFNYYFIDFI